MRTELVLRAAEVQDAAGFGVTWLVEGCGGTAQSVSGRCGNLLGVALAVLLATRFDIPFDVRAGDDTMAETGE